MFTQDCKNLGAKRETPENSELIARFWKKTPEFKGRQSGSEEWRR